VTTIPPFIVPEVRIEDIVAVMDVMGDMNPVHVDEELVAALGLRGRVNQGPANIAYVMNMLIAWAGSPQAIRRIKMRFHSISCPGDRLEARGTVVELRETKDGEDSVVAHCEVELVRDGGEAILQGQAEVLLPRSLATSLRHPDAD
jgi:acyl dehydratase